MCGVFAVIGVENAAAELYVGMVHLQHRGQDAAGLITFDFKDPNNGVKISKDIGLVSDVFTEQKLMALDGQMGIGHTRYPTVGVGDVKEVQPFFNRYPDGIALAFNGNIVNYLVLKEKLRMSRVYLSSNSDGEVLLQLFGDSYGSGSGIQRSEGCPPGGHRRICRCYNDSQQGHCRIQGPQRHKAVTHG